MTDRIRHATLRLEGIGCPDCAGGVEHGAGQDQGVASAVLPGGASHVAVLRVVDMDCHDEVRAIEGRLRGLPGVASWQVNLLERTLRVQFDAASVSPADILALIRGLGMSAELTAEVVRAVDWRRDPLFLSTALSGICLGAAFVLGWTMPSSPVSQVVHAAALCSGGWMAARKGVRAALARRLDMNVLMTVAVLGAVAIGQLDEAASVAFLFALAQLLETFSLDRARHAVRRLLAVTPPQATVRREGGLEQMQASAVAVGETIVVRPGERVALDGIVRAGASAVNQAPITGESMPVEKDAGAQVFAGSINGEGALDVEVTHAARDTVLARIVALVEEAQALKAPTQTIVERFATIYTPVVLSGAVLVAVLPPLLWAAPPSVWVYRALVLLVISCPCALVIATPVAVVCALTSAARAGILVKGGRFLEALGGLSALAVDKTGTLTKGQPVVAEVTPVNGCEAREVLRLAAAVEARSEHPLAAAVLRAARGQEVSWPEAADFRAIPGRGAQAQIEGAVYHVGSHRYIEELRVCDANVEGILAEIEDRGRTPVILSDGRRVLGIVAMADQVRDGASETVADLHGLGVKPVTILTGDTPRGADTIGHEIGADEVLSQLLPEDKVGAVRALVRRHGSVGMLGDGINDAPALAAATVGIAMGATGTDAAVETADVVLMRDDLRQLPRAVRLGRRTVRIIRTNIALSLMTKAAFVTLALLGQATLWMAVAADMGTSLVVIVNGMRLLGDPARPGETGARS